MQRTEMTKQTAKYKGLVAAGTMTTTLLLAFFLHWYFLLLGLPVTAYFAFRWLQFRAKWGMRF